MEDEVQRWAQRLYVDLMVLHQRALDACLEAQMQQNRDVAERSEHVDGCPLAWLSLDEYPRIHL